MTELTPRECSNCRHRIGEYCQRYPKQVVYTSKAYGVTYGSPPLLDSGHCGEYSPDHDRQRVMRVNSSKGFL